MALSPCAGELQDTLDIASLVTRDPIFGCDLWLGRVDEDGYPVRWDGGRPVRVHREVFEARHGPIPSGMEVDHLCRRRNCLRGVHHQLVTRAVNEQRKAFRHRMRHTKCPRGHEYPLNRMMTPEGGAICRRCSRSDEP